MPWLTPEFQNCLRVDLVLTNTSTLDNASFKPAVCSWWCFWSSKVLFWTGRFTTFWISSDPERETVLEVGKGPSAFCLPLHHILSSSESGMMITPWGGGTFFFFLMCIAVWLTVQGGPVRSKLPSTNIHLLNWCGELNSGAAPMITGNLRLCRSTTQHKQSHGQHLRKVHTNWLGVVHKVQATFFERFAESGNETQALCQWQIWDAFWPFGMRAIIAGERHRIREVVAYNTTICKLAWQPLPREQLSGSPFTFQLG